MDKTDELIAELSQMEKRLKINIKTSDTKIDYSKMSDEEFKALLDSYKPE